METRKTKRTPAKQSSKEVADKLIKVTPKTHRLLKIKAANEGSTIGDLLAAFAEGK